ncbi:MAG: hypothetical protein SFU85_01815 [Candidatus Methylacidiphilales bacterium]|nr:hypothetical protein [Candidatus Methylacidiphilales bacterium]
MIAVPQSLPLVQWHSSRQVPLSEGWLSESIAHSARNAGYTTWEWSGEVAKAITFYLQQDYPGTLITPKQLQAIIRKSLDGIGCGDIARNVSLVAPRVSIDLPEIARHSGLELIFFQHLAARLQEARHVVVKGVRLDGIRHCVKILDGSRKWDQGCQKLNDEIVLFARSHLASWKHTAVDLAVF